MTVYMSSSATYDCIAKVCKSSLPAGCMPSSSTIELPCAWLLRIDLHKNVCWLCCSIRLPTHCGQMLVIQIDSGWSANTCHTAQVTSVEEKCAHSVNENVQVPTCACCGRMVSPSSVLVSSCRRWQPQTDIARNIAGRASELSRRQPKPHSFLSGSPHFASSPSFSNLSLLQ